VKRPRRILYSVELRAALRANLQYLAEHDHFEWRELLDEDFRAVEQLLRSFPRSGTLIRARGSRELRKMRLRRTPFFVLYLCEPADAHAPVVLLHLFHVRQRSRRVTF
jgi:hypothetical protein